MSGLADPLSWGDSMRLRPLILSLFFVLTISPPSELTAQTTTSGALAGVVTDPSGAVVANAEVGLEDISRGTTQSTRTDREGVYRYFFLVPARTPSRTFAARQFTPSGHLVWRLLPFRVVYEQTGSYVPVCSGLAEF